MVLFEYAEGIMSETGPGTAKLFWDMWKKKDARTLRREMTPPFWNSLETTKSISLWSQGLAIFVFAVLAHWHKRLVGE